VSEVEKKDSVVEETVDGQVEQTKNGLFQSWEDYAWLAGFIVAVGAVAFFFWWMFFVTTVDNFELGFVFDRYTGKIEKVEKQGWVVRMPVRYSVHTIDMRPYQLTISANARVLNAKLVQFDPEGLETFVEWHGRSAGDTLHNLLEILKCYAFDPEGGKDCPFLKVISESANNQAAIPAKNVVMEKK